MTADLLFEYLRETFVGLILPVIIAYVSCIGFGIIFNIRGVNLHIAALGGAVAWMVYLIVIHYFNSTLACFWGGFACSLYSEVVARIRRAPSTCFLIIGLLPLVPGSGIYYSMKLAVEGDYAAFAERGMATLTSAGAIALGVMWVISMVRMFLHISANRRAKKKS